MTAAYLDASAVVKLFKSEIETPFLLDALKRHSTWISSELAAIEARCTARRLGDVELLAAADEVLSKMELIQMTRLIRQRAGEAFVPPLRALDAAHAATALALGDRIDTVVVYDRELMQAVAGEGLPTASPGAPTI